MMLKFRFGNSQVLVQKFLLFEIERNSIRIFIQYLESLFESLLIFI